MRDDQGDLKPLMLSELIRFAQDALRLHGDMIVWTEIEGCEGDYGEYYVTRSKPVSDSPEVHMASLHRQQNYWQDRAYQKTFVIRGI